MREGAPKFEANDEAREKLSGTFRALYNEMGRNMPHDQRMEIDKRMKEASLEALQAGIIEEDIEKIREEARGQAVRDAYEKDIERSRKERKAA
ncbi:MAG: hypothetical protein HYW91_02640 [Candidatus Sungbacteria bacterium]|nr:hypothetical protein [Candidatus Sungbacteria bacterium]